MEQSAQAGCGKDCTDEKCALAWPDGSCGRFKQGALYPPMFSPPASKAEAEQGKQSEYAVVDEAS